MYKLLHDLNIRFSVLFLCYDSPLDLFLPVEDLHVVVLQSEVGEAQPDNNREVLDE